jgi:hypothetical protein
MDKTALLATLSGDDRCFAITLEDEEATTHFPLGALKLYRVYFLQINPDESLMARNAEYIVKDEGTGTEEAAWFGGPALSPENELLSAILASPQFASIDGRIIEVRDNSVIVSGLKDDDADGVKEEVIYLVKDVGGVITPEKLKSFQRFG